VLKLYDMVHALVGPCKCMVCASANGEHSAEVSVHVPKWAHARAWLVQVHSVSIQQSTLHPPLKNDEGPWLSRRLKGAAVDPTCKCAL
jgi:hypothetical protein